VAVITGASGGIGEAIAEQLASRKKDLLLVARSKEKLEAQCRLLRERHGINAQYIAADLSQPESAVKVFTEVRVRGLEVEMLVNNAGIGSSGEFSDQSLQSELDLIQLNVSTLVSLTHLFLQQMQSRKYGTIVNIASMTAFMPVPYMAVYAASKAFVRSFTEALTQECKPKGIHVMLFAPGLTRTNFNTAAGLDGVKARGLRSDHSQASQTPEEVAIELMRALDKKRQSVVSGSRNRLGAKLLALLPNAMITKNIASSYRKSLRL